MKTLIYGNQNFLSKLPHKKECSFKGQGKDFSNRSSREQDFGLIKIVSRSSSLTVHRGSNHH